MPQIMRYGLPQPANIARRKTFRLRARFLLLRLCGFWPVFHLILKCWRTVGYTIRCSRIVMRGRSGCDRGGGSDRRDGRDKSRPYRSVCTFRVCRLRVCFVCLCLPRIWLLCALLACFCSALFVLLRV